MNLHFLAAILAREVGGGDALRPLHHDEIELALREAGEKVLRRGQRLGAVEVVGDLGHDLVLRVLGQLLLEALGAQDLRRGAGDAHDVADLHRIVAEDLVDQHRLQAAELDVVGADVGDDLGLIAAEARPVVDLDDGDAGLVRQRDRRLRAVAHRREQDEIDALRR